MNRVFNWSMANGAKILFWAAVVTFLVSMSGQILALWESLSKMASDHNSDTLPYLNIDNIGLLLGSAVANCAWLFFASILVDRLDHWLSIKEAAK